MSLGRGKGITMHDNDYVRSHGGTLGDRFADAGHAERKPDIMPLQGGRHPGGRSCAIQLGAAVMVAAAPLVVPFLPERSAARR